MRQRKRELGLSGREVFVPQVKGRYVVQQPNNILKGHHIPNVAIHPFRSAPFALDRILAVR